jgi:hypothetical protein
VEDEFVYQVESLRDEEKLAHEKLGRISVQIEEKNGQKYTCMVDELKI